MFSFLSSLLFILVLLTGPGSTSAATAGEEKCLGVRLGLDDKQFDPNAFCTKSERKKIRLSLWNAMGHRIRQVRKSGKPFDKCLELCQDSSPGNCFLSHPECHGWSSVTESSPIEGSLASDSYVDPNPDALPVDNVTGGRFLSTAARNVITPSMKRNCRSSKDAIVAELKTLAPRLQPSCQRLLRKEINISCFIL